MQTYWPPEFYGQPTHGYTPFYSQQGFMPSQFPSFPPRPMMSAMPGGLGVGTSNKWPKLNTLLAAGETLVRYDVRRRPHETILANTYHYYGPQPALITSTPVTSMRLYSKAFPWAIDIVSEKRPVTCRDVWDAVHTALQADIDDSEWALMVMQDKWRGTVEKTAKNRIEEERSASKKYKRIDFLGESTMFKGLEKDEAKEKALLLPGSTACEETWFVTFA